MSDPIHLQLGNGGEGFDTVDQGVAQVAEAGDLGRSSGEKPGVDQAGDRRPDRHGGHDRDTEDHTGIGGGERPARLGDEDDAVGSELRQRHKGGQGEVAGATDHGVSPAVGGKRLGGADGWASVNNGHGVLRSVEAGDREPGPDGEGMGGSRDRPGRAQEPGHGGRVMGEEGGGDVLGGVKGEDRGDGRCARASAGAEQGDGSIHGGFLSVRVRGSGQAPVTSRPARGGEGDSDRADALTEAGGGRGGVAVAEPGVGEVGSGEAEDPGGGEVDNDGLAVGRDEPDVAGATFGDAESAGSGHPSRSGDDPVSHREVEVAGSGGGSGEPAGGAGAQRGRCD